MAKIRKNGSKIFSAYEKAQAWAKKVNTSQIESLEWLSTLTIRQLRAIADKINTLNAGWVFCTATLGKPLGRLVKSELAEVIWDFINLKRQAPKTKYFEIDECGNVRIVTERPGADASPWTVNIGFKSYKEAETLQRYLHANGHCNASVVRKAKHCTGWAYELKVWLLSPPALKAIISKENKKLAAECKPKNWYEELQQIAQQHKLVITQPDFLWQRAKISKNNKSIGSVSACEGFSYNLNSFANSPNITVPSLACAVQKLVDAHNASLERIAVLEERLETESLLFF